MRRLIFGLCLLLAVSVRGAEIKIDFSGLAAGSTPTNFHAALAGVGQPGTWQIVMDEVPPLLAPLTDRAPIVTRRGVLAQTSQDTTDEHFPMLIFDGGEPFKEFKLTTRFKIIGGIAEQMAGVVFRYQNASNFYVVRASALGRNIRFYKMVDGIRTDPLGPQLAITTNDWHTLAVQCQGNQISIWLDDQPVMPPLQDNTFVSGKVGFWTKSDAVSYFCDPVIEYTPRVPAAQMLVRSIMEEQPRIVGLRIYALDGQGGTHVIASKEESEIGQPRRQQADLLGDMGPAIGLPDAVFLFAVGRPVGACAGARQQKLGKRVPSVGRGIGRCRRHPLPRAPSIRRSFVDLCGDFDRQIAIVNLRRSSQPLAASGA